MQGTIAPKQKINGLVEEEIEIGEEAQKTIQGVTCEHNLTMQPLLGNLILTNYKIVFKAAEYQLNSITQKTISFMGKSRI